MSEFCSEAVSKELLEGYFSKHGMLLCNESKDMPSLSSVGGDWSSIVGLIEEGKVFHSRFYKGRVTYLSREFYGQIKHYRQRENRLSKEAQSIYSLLNEIGLANTEEIKRLLNLSGKVFSGALQELGKELLVTAIKRDRTMNQNWSSFAWGPWSFWESLHPITDIPVSVERAEELLKGLVSEREIKQFLK